MAIVRKNFMTFEEWCESIGKDIVIEPGDKDGFLAGIDRGYRAHGKTEKEAIDHLSRNYEGKMGAPARFVRK